MEKKSYKSITIITTIIFIITISLFTSSCAALDTWVQSLKGELVGNDYVITQYDNFGNKVLKVSGDKIALSAETDNAGEITSYLDITIDGFDWKHVGSTLVFAQNGVDMITDFELNDIQTSGDMSTGIMGIDRFINDYKNDFGRSYVVLVSSQNGTPIGLFRGDKCNVSIPSDLPKVTLINIDGKLVYVHRANVDIISATMFDNFSE